MLRILKTAHENGFMAKKQLQYFFEYNTLILREPIDKFTHGIRETITIIRLFP